MGTVRPSSRRRSGRVHAKAPTRSLDRMPQEEAPRRAPQERPRGDAILERQVRIERLPQAVAQAPGAPHEHDAGHREEEKEDHDGDVAPDRAAESAGEQEKRGGAGGEEHTAARTRHDEAGDEENGEQCGRQPRAAAAQRARGRDQQEKRAQKAERVGIDRPPGEGVPSAASTAGPRGGGSSRPAEAPRRRKRRRPRERRSGRAGAPRLPPGGGESRRPRRRRAPRRRRDSRARPRKPRGLPR